MSQAVLAGSAAIFSVAATGPNLLFQWQRSVDAALTWTDIAGAVASTYTIAVVDASMNGQQYRAVVRSGSASVTTTAATLSISPPVQPAISQQPADQAVLVGASAVFSVAASGGGLVYRWQQRATSTAPWADVMGATAATLTLNPAVLTDNGLQLRVVVSNSAGSATSATATLAVSPAPAAPAITTQPADVSVQAGQPATFSVVVTGYPTPALQWQSSSNGGASFSDLPGATAATYSAPAVVLGASGTQYRVRASNATGAVTSAVATLTVTPAPTVVLRDVALSIGLSGCAVRADASLACWGDNQSAQVDGANQWDPAFRGWWFGSPIAVPGVSAIEQVATGPHTCAVRTNGTVMCWGVNAWGQLGLGPGTTSTFFSTRPTVVPGLTGVAAVKVGGAFTCALKTDGTVACWGLNNVGQLGDGSTTNRLSPTAVPGLGSVTAISTGGAHACALRANGTVLCWGDNSGGALGDGTTINRTSPVAVLGLTNARAVATGDGSGHTCALKSDATVACWGSSGSGAHGFASMLTTPRLVPGVADAVAIAVSDVNTCVIKAAGTVACWGSNASGQFGTGSPALPVFSLSPVVVPGLSDVVAIAIGSGANCAVKSNGSVLCWGYNAFGALADGTLTSRSRPQPINGLTLRLR